MSMPQEGYPPAGYPDEDPYGQQQPQQEGQPGFGAPPPEEQPQQHQAHGKKKKNRYAEQAFEFGMGGNAAIQQQQQQGMPPGAPDSTFIPAGAPTGNPYGGYAAPAPTPSYSGNQPYTDNPTPASHFGQSAMAGLGGYQAPDMPAVDPLAYPAGPQGLGGITAGMGNMGLGGPQTVLGPGMAKLPMNQLYPTDLLNQPFNVAELELPPPPIILPSNVRYIHSEAWYAS